MGLRRVHEHEIDRIAGTAELVRTNPVRDYGWNDAKWNGQKSEEKVGETQRVLAQRLHGTEEVNFFTAEGDPIPCDEVPQWILDDIKKRPLIAEEGGQVDTIVICKVCRLPYPRSIYPQHLESHIQVMLDTTAAAKAEVETKNEPRRAR